MTVAHGGGDGDGAGPSLTLQGCASVRSPAECVAVAGLPPPGRREAPGSVVPRPQRWGPLSAEPEIVPKAGERAGRQGGLCSSNCPQPSPHTCLTSVGPRPRRVLLAEFPLMSRRICSWVSSWGTRRPLRPAACSSHSFDSPPAKESRLSPLPPEGPLFDGKASSLCSGSLAGPWLVSHHQPAPAQDPLLLGL